MSPVVVAMCADGGGMSGSFSTEGPFLAAVRGAARGCESAGVNVITP